MICSEIVCFKTATYFYIRERPFNLKGGGLCFFSKKNIPIPNVAEKYILILVEEKKNLIQSLCHITQCWILEKKIRALRDKIF